MVYEGYVLYTPDCCCLLPVVCVVSLLTQALQVLRMHSADTGERALFIDKMLDHQNLILDEHDDEVARLRFFEEVLVKGAVAQGELTEDQFRW